MDLMYWGGPVGPQRAKAVEWLRPTEILNIPGDGGQNTGNYIALRNAGGGFAWRKMCEKAGIAPDQLGSLGIGGFSAAHLFIESMLNNEVDFEKVDAIYLADACFQAYGQRTPKPGMLKAAKAAVDGKKRMVATSNGPLGKDIKYSWDYDDDRGHVDFALTSGGTCVQNFWNVATQGHGISRADHPSFVAPPAFAKKCGELYWFHYENPPKKDHTGKSTDPHGFHGTISTAYMDMYIAPWMAGRRNKWRNLIVPVSMIAMAGAGIAIGAKIAKKKSERY